MQIHLSRMLRLTCGKAGTSRGGTGNLSPSQETINCYGIFFASLAPLSAASLTWRTLCTRKAHVSPRGFPGERFTNHSPLVSANKADSFEIGSAGILRPTPFTLSPEA